MPDSLYSYPETAESLAEKPPTVLPKQKSSFGKKNLSIFVGGLAVGLVIGAGGFAVVDNLQQETGSENNSVQLTSSSAEAILEAVKYKDGVYEADALVTIESANLTHTVRVVVEVSEGQIASASVYEVDEDGSQVENTYMDAFAAKLTDLVVGKELDEVEGLTLVSGSTLTSNAFKAAVSNIKTEAEHAAVASTTYEDGRYYAQARFDVPGQDREIFHNIGVTLEIEEGLIVNVITTEVDEDGQPIANEHIDEFDLAVEEIIIGKTIDESMNLDTVSGSSYTTQGFNEAISLINQEASLN